MIDFIYQSVFGEIAMLLVLAAAVGAVGLLLRQPLIVSFIAAGLLAGPSALDLVRSAHEIELMAELGIAILLFLVGIKLDLKLIRSLGPVSVLTGLGQVFFTSAIGFLIGLALGFDAVVSLYIAVALTFSSTIIIVKLLSDKREIDSLHGQVALGFLIVQDLVVVLAMIVLSAIGMGAGSDNPVSEIVTIFASGAVIAVVVFVLIRFVVDPVTERLAEVPELLISFAIALAVLFAAVGDVLGFGKELGGLLAGVTLASTRYRETIASRLAPLRDFLLLFFFVALGVQLDLTTLGANIPAALIFSAFVLIGNPLIVLAIMGALGFRKRTGFLAGLTVAQISEFSLLFIGMGVAIGHLNNDTLGLVTLVGLVTIAASTYMITYSHQIYAVFEPFLKIFERKTVREPDHDGLGKGGYDVIMFGLGRFGGALTARLLRQGQTVLGIDFNPSIMRHWRGQGLDVLFGDSTDAEFIAGLPLDKARWVVASMPVHATGVTHDDPRRALISALREAGYRGKIAVTCSHTQDSETLATLGADLVLEPFQDAADRAIELLEGDILPERIEQEDDAI